MTKKYRKTNRQYGGVDADVRLNDRREKFISAGLEAFGTTGYVKSTIKEICRFAGLTERYFYESFQNKEDLLVAVYRRLIDETVKETSKIFSRPGISSIDAAKETLKMFFGYFQKDPRRARIQLFELLGVSSDMDREYHIAMQTLISTIENFSVTIFDIDRDWLKSSVLSTSIAGAIMNVAKEWAFEGFKMPVDDIVSQIMDGVMILGSHYHRNDGDS
jgi:AcrR family transcriptional regulator